MCLNTGTAKNINFSFETNGKSMALGVPILQHFRVLPFFSSVLCHSYTGGNHKGTTAIVASIVTIPIL